MTSAPNQCPIWGEKCPQEWDDNASSRKTWCREQSGDEMVCKCIRAGGSFKVSGPNPEVRMQSMVAALSGDAKVRLCGQIARENLVHKNIPVVDEGFVRLAETGCRPTMLERLDLALEWLVLSSDNKFGAHPFDVQLGEGTTRGEAMHEKSLAFMAYAHGHGEECLPMLYALGEKIKYQISEDSKKIIGASVTVTPAGFAYYEEWQGRQIQNSQSDKNQGRTTVSWKKMLGRFGGGIQIFAAIKSLWPWLKSLWPWPW